MLKKIIFSFLFTSIFITNQAFGVFPETEADFLLLPPFCTARLGKSKELRKWNPTIEKKWKKKLGTAYLHVHHYCASLHSFRVAKEIFPTNINQKNNKSFLLNEALAEVNYMEHSTTKPTNLLFPYIYTTKAEIYLEVQQEKKGVEYFNKAINANKKFTKPYALLSDFFQKEGNKKDALKTLKEGLKYSPQSRALNKRLKKLSK